MECPTCGAALLPSDARCAVCAGKPVHEPAAPAASDASDEPPTRPFAEITPYSGPYPPAYVQVSSSETRPGPVNTIAKWTGLLWSAVVPLCIFLGLNDARTNHIGDTENANGSPVSLYIWIAVWAAVAVPAFAVFRTTRPKLSRNPMSRARRRPKPGSR